MSESCWLRLILLYIYYYILYIIYYYYSISAEISSKKLGKMHKAVRNRLVSSNSKSDWGVQVTLYKVSEICVHTPWVGWFNRTIWLGIRANAALHKLSNDFWSEIRLTGELFCIYMCVFCFSYECVKACYTWGEQLGL